MTYKEIYEKAANMLDRGEITLGDFNKMVEPLNSEVQSEITHEQAVEYLQSTGWMREHDLQMMLDGVHRLTAQPEPHWIPVEQALPKEPFGCLVTVMDTNPMTMEDFENILPYFVGWDGEQWNDCDGEQCPFEVLAWWGLPEPYKGVTE